MISRLQKNDGITLIELLATIAILSIISILIYSVLIDGLNYSKKSEDKVAIQQEMNILLTALTKAHETYASYDIVIDQNPNGNKIQIIGKNDTGSVVGTVEISNENFLYSLINDQGGTEVNLSTSTHVDTSHPLYIKVIIKNKNQPSLSFEESTIINRL